MYICNSTECDCFYQKRLQCTYNIRRRKVHARSYCVAPLEYASITFEVWECCTLTFGETPNQFWISWNTFLSVSSPRWLAQTPTLSTASKLSACTMHYKKSMMVARSNFLLVMRKESIVFSCSIPTRWVTLCSCKSKSSITVGIERIGGQDIVPLLIQKGQSHHHLHRNILAEIERSIQHVMFRRNLIAKHFLRQKYGTICVCIRCFSSIKCKY